MKIFLTGICCLGSGIITAMKANGFFTLPLAGFIPLERAHTIIGFISLNTVGYGPAAILTPTFTPMLILLGTNTILEIQVLAGSLIV